VRFGIIGLGWAARAFHLPGIKAVPGGVAVGGCDPSADQRAAFAKETGLPTYATFAELVEHERPDVVIIATSASRRSPPVST
jgi:phthalate 4,5-cis-dihydrodiol dehydrogenase